MGHRQGGGAGLIRLATGTTRASRPSVTATGISEKIHRFCDDDAASYEAR